MIQILELEHEPSHKIIPWAQTKHIYLHSHYEKHLSCQRYTGWNKIWPPLQLVLGLTWWLSCERTCLPMQEIQEMWVRSLGWEDPLKTEMKICSSILAWKFHGQRSLLAYSPCGHKESGMTKQTHTHPHTCTQLVLWNLNWYKIHISLYLCKGETNFRKQQQKY